MVARYVCAELGKFILDLPGSEDKQVGNVYQWEAFELPAQSDPRVTLPRLMHEAGMPMAWLTISEANALLEDLASAFNLPVPGCVYDHADAQWASDPPYVLHKYDVRRMEVVSRRPDIPDATVIHEFAHHVVAASCFFVCDCLFSPGRTGEMPLLMVCEGHGPIFMQAYVEVLSHWLCVDSARIRKSAESYFRVATADRTARRWREAMRTASLEIDSGPLRSLLAKGASLEATAYQGV